MDGRTLLPFKQSDLIFLKVVPWNASMFDDLLRDEGAMSIMGESPVGFTLWDKTGIVGCFGITESGYAWTILGIGFQKHLKYIIKESIKVMNEYGPCFTFNRVGRDNENKWCESLGFQREGIVTFEENGLEYVKYVRSA